MRTKDSDRERGNLRLVSRKSYVVNYVRNLKERKLWVGKWEVNEEVKTWDTPQAPPALAIFSASAVSEFTNTKHSFKMSHNSDTLLK